MRKYIFDSHGVMPQMVVNQNENETEREFNRRCWYLYLEMCAKYDGYNGSGNTVYMSDNERRIY